MANTKISQLTPNTNPNGWEELVYAYNNTNGKMTLNTMKTFASSDSQPTLVSGTNIKTINNQSILWPWNITIQWWGWWGDAIMYDAVVDAGWNGDYTTIWAALAANKRKIFIVDWTYNETEWNFITMSAVDWLIIHWQSRDWVVVNCTLDAVATQWAEVYNYPAFIFVDMNATTNWSIDIENITFKLTINTTQVNANLVRFRTAYASGTHFNNFYIANCSFICTNTWSNARFDIVDSSSDSQSPIGAYDIYSCSVDLISSAARLWYWSDDYLTRNESCIHKNCSFIAREANNNEARIEIRRAFDCDIRYISSWLWSFRLSLYDSDNCNIYVPDNKPWYVNFSNLTNCYIDWWWGNWSWVERIPSHTVFTEWTANTAYTTSDYVYVENAFYKCNTDHTSASDFYSDNEDEYWDNVAMYNASNLRWCIIKTDWNVSLRWRIVGCSFGSYYDNSDLMLYKWTIVEWNYLYLSNANMFVCNHCVINWNSFWDWYDPGDWYIYYDATWNSIITNNLLWTISLIKAEWSWGSSVVANNAAWS